MNYILFDDADTPNLYPLTWTKPISELRIGILTMKERWEKLLGQKISLLPAAYLREKFPLIQEQENLLINSAVLPDLDFINEIQNIQTNEVLIQDEKILAFRTSYWDGNSFSPEKITAGFLQKKCTKEQPLIKYPWDIFTRNEIVLKEDFKLITKGKKSQKLSNTVHCPAPERVFLEEGARVEYAVLNPGAGYIYVGKNAEIMEGCLVRGSLAMGESSVLKLGTKIYGATTLGPHCKVGGELNNSILQGYSNKAHDGFLGNSVIGEWCNLGADTNNSNLKNNYAPVKMWNYPKERFINTGLQFCGLIMGDHSKCGINTMFNTGTVIGVSSNIYGSGFPRQFVPSFSWGSSAGMKTYQIKKAFETAELVMSRRNKQLEETDKKILQYIFEQSQKFRH